jgi:hypothetical protein
LALTEFISALDGIAEAVRARITPEQAALEAGHCALTTLNDDVLFGVVATHEQLIELAMSMGLTTDEAEWQEETRDKTTIVFANWYCVEYPHGIMLPVWRHQVWPLECELLQQAMAHRWDMREFDAALYGSVSACVAMMKANLA